VVLGRGPEVPRRRLRGLRGRAAPQGQPAPEDPRPAGAMPRKTVSIKGFRVMALVRCSAVISSELAKSAGEMRSETPLTFPLRIRLSR